MSRMRFTMQPDEGRSVICTFVNGSGAARSTWFSAPPASIDHVHMEYLQGRFSHVVRREQMVFIKRRYKEEYQRLLNPPNKPIEAGEIAQDALEAIGHD